MTDYSALVKGFQIAVSNATIYLHRQEGALMLAKQLLAEQETSASSVESKEAAALSADPPTPLPPPVQPPEKHE